MFSRWSFDPSSSAAYAEESQDEGFGSSTSSDLQSQPTRGESLPATNRHYQWQLYDGQRWIRINNDHVIEAHYCQPGAKGIKISIEEHGTCMDR